MKDDPQLKRMLVGLGPARPKCGHQGFIIPIVMMPQVIEAPAPEGQAPIKVQIFTTLTAKCLACGQQFEFGPAAPKTDEKPVAEPGNLG